MGEDKGNFICHSELNFGSTGLEGPAGSLCPPFVISAMTSYTPFINIFNNLGVGD